VAAAHNLRRLLEELALDQADLTRVKSIPGDVDLAEGNALIAETIAAARGLADAPRGDEK
jgi:hypothetical protein